MSKADIRSYYDYLMSDNGHVEIRHHIDGRWVSCWFDSVPELLSFMRAKYQSGDLYTSLNAPKPGVARSGGPVTNEDVAWITRLPFDFDPVRPSGTASTGEDLQSAMDRASACYGFTAGLGLPMPLMALSGNGCHLQWRTRLPNNTETSEMLSAIYQGIGAMFSDDMVKFDVTVRNPGRIFRAYGSMNRKGGKERRTDCWMPPTWPELSRAQVEGLANHFANRAAEVPDAATGRKYSTGGGGDFRTLDAPVWFAAHGLYQKRIGGNKHAVTCPWADQHGSKTKPKDSVIWVEAGRWPTFHCSHNSCAGRHMADVIKLFGDADQFCSSSFVKVRHA